MKAIKLFIAIAVFTAVQLAVNTDTWAQVTCGNGAGQTPFTITASVTTNYNGQSISCNGANDGAATVSVVGGVGPFSYQWVGGQQSSFTQNYTNLGAGTYTIIVTDLGQGVTCVDNVQLTEPAQLAVLFFIETPPSCAGSCDGTATPIVIGGVGPYNYAWSNGETGLTAMNLCEGLTELVVTDANNCVLVLQYEAELNETQANLTTVDVLCSGDATGEASVTPVGGNGGPYTILWSTGAGGNTIVGLAAGLYSVDVTDVSGCTITENFEIFETAVLDAFIDDTTDLQCENVADGSITASANGGTPPYTFSWTGPNGYTGNGETITDLDAGSYTLVVTDLNGCEATIIAELTAPAAIVIASNVIDASCNGASDGAIGLVVTGGNGGYMYSWTGPNGFTANSQNITNVAAGSYTVEVTDLLGCAETAVIEVDEPLVVDLDAAVVDVLCNGDATGSIQVTPLGGTPPYTYAWTGPNGFTGNTALISNLAAGNYALTLTDDNDCTVEVAYDVLEPSAITIDAVVDDISCNGATDGTITVTVSGGAEPYTLAWTGPHGASNDPVINNVGAGTYILTVTDDNGCEEQLTVNVDEPQAIVILPITTEPSCGGLDDGAIALTLSGGTAPYTVALTGPNGFTANTEDITGLFAGTYSATVTDFNGCEAFLDVEVTEPVPVAADATIVDILCNGGTTGSIAILPSGGTPNYTFAWTGPNGFTANGNPLINAGAGSYTLTLTDANGCELVESYGILQPDAIDVTIDLVPITCNGADDATLTAIVSGGVAPYTYAWTGPSGASTDPVVNNAAPGTWNLTVIDANLCQVLSTIEVDEPTPVVLTPALTEPDCGGNATGAIDLAVSGGVEPYTVAWTGPNGFTSAQFILNNLLAGTYDAEVIDFTGCVTTASYTLNENDPLVIDGSSSDISCNGAGDGSITLNITGGALPYIIAWTGQNGFTSTAQNLSNLEAGSYDVTVTDANDCFSMLGFTIAEPAEFSVTVDAIDPECFGDANGSITLNITGGIAPLNILWNTGDTDAVLNGLTAGTYSAVVTDDSGCTLNTGNVVLNENPVLQLQAVAGDLACAGETTGSVSLNITGGLEPYTIAWTGPNGFTSDQAVLANLEAGSYSVAVTDAANCTVNLDIEVETPNPIALNADVSDVVCGGFPTGAIDLTVTGGTAPYTYLWSGPGFQQTTQDVNNLISGNYSVVVEDAAGCVAMLNVVVNQNPPLDANVTAFDSECNLNTGEASAIAFGGVGMLTLTWFQGAVEIGTGATITDLAAGSYTFVVVDELGCDFVFPFNISDSGAADISATTADILCNGDLTGAVDLTATGGTGNLTYAWSGPDNFTSDSEDITELTAGTYTVTVTDELGCEGLLSVNLTEPELLEAAIALDEVSCAGVNDGSITVLITGGTQPYDILWSGPNGFTATTESLPAVGPGTYTLDVIDNNGCTLSETVNVLQVEGFDLDIALTNIDCNGDDTGAITVDVLTGTGPFTTFWSGPNGYVNNFQNIGDLFAGDYTLTLTDATGCSVDTTVTITQNTTIALGVNAIEPSCDQNDGSLQVVISGGAGGYSIFWYDLSNGNALVGTTAVLSNIGSGNYFVEVFDALGCTESSSVVLSDNVGDIAAVVNDVTCPQAADGSIEITVTGGTEPYTYAWTGPNGFASADPNIENLAAGTYTVEVNDADGCVLFGAYIIDEALPFAINLDATEILCNGDANGTLSATAGGGTAPYTYAWTGPNGFTSDQNAIADLAPGTYTVTITDFVGCESVATSELVEPSILGLVINLTDVNCNATDDGSIQAVLSGGTAPYTYAWSGPNGFAFDQANLANLSAGTYTLNATDANGCGITSEATITQLSIIDLDFIVTNIDCNGDVTGAIDVVINSGIAPYTTAWTSDNGFVSNDLSIANLFAGEYTLTISDATGCETVVSANVTESDLLAIGVNQTEPSCNANDGELEVVITGGTGNYSIIWYDLSNGNAVVGNDPVLSNIGSGNYFVEVFDALGCTESTSVVLSDNVGDLSANITDVNCAGANDGAIALTVTGATAPFTFAWSGVDGYASADQNPMGLAAGEYTVEVTDADGCTLFGVYTVNEGSTVNLDIAITDISCGGANDGALATTASNGTAPYTIAWSGPDGFSSDQNTINGLAAGTYSVTVTDANGCEATLEVEIIEPTAIAIVLDGTDISCTANDDGAIDATVSGGTEPYTIVWSGPDGFSSDQTQLAGLVAGTYEITVTDDAGCILSQEITIDQIEGIDVNITVTDVNCGGDDTGAIDLEILSDEAPYTTAWTGPNGFVNNFEDLSNLFAGDYTVTVTDSEGCSSETTVTVSENEPIALGINATEPACNTADGALEVVITGGSGNYFITWLDLTNGNVVIGNNPVVSNIPSGSYFVEVVDDLGCVASTSVPLSDDAGNIEPTISGVSCNGANDGSISVVIVGGTEPYTYAWTGPDGFTSDQADVSGLVPGEYSLAVEDALGCALFGVYEITQPDALSVTADATDIQCFGEANGTLTANPIGGTPDYSYAWTGPDGFASDQAQLADLAAGCYDLTVTDANGCEATMQQCIAEPSLLEAEAISTGIVCAGDATGSIEVLPTGGTGNYTFEWSGPDGFTSTDQDLFDLFAGTYILTLADEGACAVEIEVEVTENPVVDASVTTTEPQCAGGNNGSLEITPSGGIAPYTINWFDADGEYLGNEFLLENLTAGTYTYTVTDAFSCQIEGEASLNETLALQIEGQVNQPSCAGISNGQIIATVTGGTEPYTYQWSGPNGYTADAAAIADLEPGNYQLTVTDANGCEGEAEFTLDEPADLVLTLDEVVDSPCLSDSDGAISISVSGGSEPYSFAWSGPDGFTSGDEDLSDLFAGSYALTVTDAGGCSAELSEVTVDFLGDVMLSPSADEVLCFGEELLLEATNSGATDSFWSDDDGNEVAEGDTYAPILEPGSYTFIYTASDGGCVRTDTVEVTVNGLPSAEAGANQLVFPQGQTTLGGNPTTEDGNLIVWMPSDFLITDDEANPETTPLAVDTDFFLEVIDANGCVGRDTVTVSIIPEVNPPSGFTPNGDGINDFWIIDNAELYPSIVVEIYNRWGELLFRTEEGYQTPWDGTYNGGQLPVGTYYFVIQINEPLYEATINGPITILR
ncbi:MAG: gliding motility-associated C-terminal domain-containing protein [Flavobacteriales bacterium]